MKGPRIGSLCTGYGGLDHAAAAVFGGEVAWTSDVDTGASRIIAHRYPGVPNIGDMTAVDWSALEPVDVLTAGYPCQPFSQAGRRKGTNDDRHLWPYVRDAIRVLRPRITLLENVAGHRSLGFDRVLGDLAEDGMHVWWTSLRASDVGAPHRRERLFIVVTDPAAFADPGLLRRNAGRRTGPGGRRVDNVYPLVDLLPTPTRQDGKNNAAPSQYERQSLALNVVVTLLPTPVANDARQTAVAPSRSGPGRLNYGPELSSISELLPTPTASDADAAGNGTGVTLTDATPWGAYRLAVERWEDILGRPAPPPTSPGRTGRPQLSAPFVEWMMGLPTGWVTGTPGLSRAQALKALGNGVVPMQAEAALSMWADFALREGVA